MTNKSTIVGLTLLTYLDKTFDSVNYECCGIGSTTNRDGVGTFYSYDALKRRTSEWETPFNIVTTSIFDANGSLLATKRTGDTIITLQQTAYDDAGRVIFQTNALNGPTAYNYSFDSGHRVTTITNPDLGTRVETYYLDGALKSVTGTGVHPVSYTYGNGCTKETKLNGLNPTEEWVQTFTDGLGRQTGKKYPDGASSQLIYNGQGQPWKQIDPDNVTTLYEYNGKGEQIVTAVAMVDRNENSPDLLNDRVTKTINDVSRRGQS